MRTRSNLRGIGEEVATPFARWRPFAILSSMTKLLQDAIERLKELPESRQNELAAALIDVAEGDQGDYHLTDEQVEEVRRRRSNPNRKFVSLAQARKRLRHYGV
jgi:4-aminobutyrate aminotransferase-like enzyme